MESGGGDPEMTPHEQATMEVYSESLAHLSLAEREELMRNQTGEGLQKRMVPRADEVAEREDEIRRYRAGLLKGADLRRRRDRIANLEEEKLAIREQTRRKMTFMELLHDGNALHDEMVACVQKSKAAARAGRKKEAERLRKEALEMRDEVEMSSRIFHQRFGLYLYGSVGLATLGVLWLAYRSYLWFAGRK